MFFFFFQAEDGIRDYKVTGVQTCALPILYAQLTAFGEAAVGLGLVFGCCTTLAAAIGLVLVANCGLAVQWQGSAQQGFPYLLITTLVVILGARAGRGRSEEGRVGEGGDLGG